jgi:AcrR family transcriptional regulator
MFLEKGFDGFRVTDVAEACGVSEKTVYNYFPTKESLILDREEDLTAAIRRALGAGNDAKSPVEAILDVLAAERQQMRAGLADVGGEELGLQMFRRFFTMMDETPQLVAASNEMMNRLARVAAESLAERAGVSPDDPEPVITAQALVGLWRVQFHALHRYTGTDLPPDEIYAKVEEEVGRAARLIDTGLWSFSAMTSGSGSREQMKLAAEAAKQAGTQVAAALRQARKMWTEMQSSHPEHPHDDADWGDWRTWAGAGSREQWREMQRELVQHWREAQREHSQQWREAHRAYAEEQREARRRMKQEMRESARAAAHDAVREAKRQAKDG